MNTVDWELIHDANPANRISGTAESEQAAVKAAMDAAHAKSFGRAKLITLSEHDDYTLLIGSVEIDSGGWQLIVDNPQ